MSAKNTISHECPSKFELNCLYYIKFSLIYDYAPIFRRNSCK